MKLALPICFACPAMLLAGQIVGIYKDDNRTQNLSYSKSGTMKRKFPNIFLMIPASLISVFFVACGPAALQGIETPTPSRTLEFTATSALDTLTPSCNGTCPEDSLTLTAAMGLTFAAIPSNTPPPWATIYPTAGDLGWGSVYGTIVDGHTGSPLEGATVECEHFSYTSPYRCEGITTTNSDGIYSFTPVYFHDTDKITLLVEAPGYTPLRFEQAFFTRPEFQANLGLFPESDGIQTPTLTPFVMCTAPACPGGDLICGVLEGCPGGCGTICMPATPTP